MSKIGRSYQQLWKERSTLIDVDKQTSRHVMYHNENKNKTKISNTAFKGVFDRTVLNQTYMSPENIQRVQNAIRYQVWKQTNSKISEQDQINLTIIMRDVFISHSKHIPGAKNVAPQIKELNEIVVEKITPYIISNVKQHIRYLVDANLPYRIMDRHVSMSSAGTRTAPLDTTIGF